MGHLVTFKTDAVPGRMNKTPSPDRIGFKSALAKHARNRFMNIAPVDACGKERYPALLCGKNGFVCFCARGRRFTFEKCSSDIREKTGYARIRKKIADDRRPCANRSLAYRVRIGGVRSRRCDRAGSKKTIFEKPLLNRITKHFRRKRIAAFVQYASPNGRF